MVKVLKVFKILSSYIAHNLMSFYTCISERVHTILTLGWSGRGGGSWWWCGCDVVWAGSGSVCEGKWGDQNSISF